MLPEDMSLLPDIACPIHSSPIISTLLPLRNSRKQCLVMGMQIPYMKAATNTLDSVVVQRPSCKQNLCLDKGYDFSEIEREVIKRRH